MKTIIAALGASSLLCAGSYIVNGARGCRDHHGQPTAARLNYWQFRNAVRSRNADASAAGAAASLRERELRGAHEFWRAMPVRAGGSGRQRGRVSPRRASS
jgi:hypothetical protein